MLQSNGQIGRGQCRVDNVDGSSDVWTVSSAVRVDVEFELTRGPQVRIEELGKVQIYGAEQETGHRCVARRWNSPLELQIGIGTADRRTLHADDLVLVVDVNGRGCSELHSIAVSELENRNRDVRFKLLLVLKWTVECGVKFSLPRDVGRLIGCVSCEERAQRDPLRVKGGIDEIVVAERYLCAGLDRGVHRR